MSQHDKIAIAAITAALFLGFAVGLTVESNLHKAGDPLSQLAAAVHSSLNAGYSNIVVQGKAVMAVQNGAYVGAVAVLAPHEEVEMPPIVVQRPMTISDAVARSNLSVSNACVVGEQGGEMVISGSKGAVARMEDLMREQILSEYMLPDTKRP